MPRLAHIIAVKQHPHEIEESYVPIAKERERTAILLKRYDTVFTLRTFEASRDSEWGNGR